MKIESRPVTVRELIESYQDSGEEGVVAYGGQLDVRPPYQREFVYSEAQQQAVIQTALSGAPLSIIYWAKRNPSGEDINQAQFEVLDGQQRLLSLCGFFNGLFSISSPGGGEPMYHHNLPENLRQQILNYELMVYTCEGDDDAKLRWFQVINTAGEKLTEQELRNAVYSGPWVTDAKRRFSRTGGAAASLGGGYVKGTPIRQELLELALKWIVSHQGLPSIEAYMAAHSQDANALELWGYYRDVVEWAQTTFPKERRQLGHVNWGDLFDRFGGSADLDPMSLEVEVSRLMADPDVTRKTGVYDYVLSGDERALSIRAFPEVDRTTAYESQGGACALCREVQPLSDMHADHIVPWSKGGKTEIANLQMLCTKCNLSKGAH